MMKSLILTTLAPWVLALVLSLSLFILWKGHQTPGGGFIAGLMASLALILYSQSLEGRQTKRRLKTLWISMMGVGLLLSASSLLFSRVWVEFLNQMWGAPQLFDVGVYFVVTSMGTLLIDLVMEN